MNLALFWSPVYYRKDLTEHQRVSVGAHTCLCFCSVGLVLPWGCSYELWVHCICHLLASLVVSEKPLLHCLNTCGKESGCWEFNNLTKKLKATFSSESKMYKLFCTLLTANTCVMCALHVSWHLSEYTGVHEHGEEEAGYWLHCSGCRDYIQLCGNQSLILKFCPYFWPLISLLFSLCANVANVRKWENLPR